MDKHLFDENRFTKILTRKLSGTALTEEEAYYFKSHLISDDPFVSRRCQEIIAEVTAKQPLPSTSPAHELDMEKEYEQMLSALHSKKNTSHKFIIIIVLLIFILLCIAAFFLFLL